MTNTTAPTTPDTVTRINANSIFHYYKDEFGDQIFTIRELFSLLEENDVGTAHMGIIFFALINRIYSPNPFSRVRHFGEAISDNGFNYAFLECYDKIMSDANDEEWLISCKAGDANEIPHSKKITKREMNVIEKVVCENRDRLNMLEPEIYLKNSEIISIIEDMYSRLNRGENTARLVFFLALYNTYVVEKITLSNKLAQRVHKLLKGGAGKSALTSKYYTTNEIILLFKDSPTVLKDEECFWRSAEEFPCGIAEGRDIKYFNYRQIAKICWTARALDMLDKDSDNEILYVIFQTNSSFIRGMEEENKKLFLEKLEKAITPAKKSFNTVYK